ncbi:MAG: RluA family pseudouridine synthase, partial [Bacteroidales bacterium]|nr:RluA family pseudouridine synthase [Bacteroidales bacterium]
MRAGQKNKEESALEVNNEIILMTFLLQNLKQKSRDNIKSLLRNKRVLVNGQTVTQFNHPLKPGDGVKVRWEAAIEGSINRNMSILYEDDHLVVIDKHAGLLTIATDKEKDRTAYTMLSSHVKLQNPANRIFIVHRLDRDTSGVMMFAKSEKVQSIMQSEWKERVKERTYIAVVEGQVVEAEGKISSYIYESKSLVMHSSQNPEKGELAVTRFRTLKSNRD